LTGANIAYGSPNGDLGSDSEDLTAVQQELNKKKQKIIDRNNKDKLTPDEEKTVNMYMAMADADKENDPELKFLKRHAAISSFITNETAPHLSDKMRAERIDTLARTSVPLVDIEDTYSRAKNVVRRTASMAKYNTYTAGTYNDGGEDKSTLLKQLEIMEFEV